MTEVCHAIHFVLSHVLKKVTCAELLHYYYYYYYLLLLLLIQVFNCPDLHDKFETAKTETVIESSICRLRNNCVSSSQRDF